MTTFTHWSLSHRPGFRIQWYKLTNNEDIKNILKSISKLITPPRKPSMNPNLIISTIEDGFFIPIENRKNHWPILLWWAELQPVSRLDMSHKREFQELPDKLKTCVYLSIENKKKLWWNFFECSSLMDSFLYQDLQRTMVLMDFFFSHQLKLE